MPPTLAARVWGEKFGEPETGFWCDACMLPSVIRGTVAVGSEMYVFGFWVYEECQECGRHRMRPRKVS